MFALYNLPVHHIKEVLWKFHLVPVLNIKVAPVFNIWLHFFPVKKYKVFRCKHLTSRPTSESSSKELNLSSVLIQTWTRPDLDLN